MNILIVYDSLFGNTEKVAHQIAQSLGSYTVRLLTAREATPKDMELVELLIVGSPTHGGNCSPVTTEFLNRFTKGSLNNIRGAAFDTGISACEKKGFMRFLIGLIGYADKHIAKSLKKNGAKVVGSETFFVLDKEGPLKDGELERSGRWATELVNKE